MPRTLITLLLLAHGLVHTVDVVVRWRLARSRGLPYATASLGGRLELGRDGARALGVAWLVTALSFLASSAGAWTHGTWWLPLAGAAAASSIALCLLSAPFAVGHLAIDLLILLGALYLPLMGSGEAPRL